LSSIVGATHFLLLFLPSFFPSFFLRSKPDGPASQRERRRRRERERERERERRKRTKRGPTTPLFHYALIHRIRHRDRAGGRAGGGEINYRGAI
jgi:hypothetical protein